MNYYDKDSINLDQFFLSRDRYARKGFIIETVILFILIFISAKVIDSVGGGIEDQQPIMLAIVAPVILEHIRASTKRWHDVNMGGWAVMLQILTLGLAYIFLFVKRGTVGINKYGTDPLYEKNNYVAKMGKCPKCKNKLATITEKRRKYVICPLKHGFVNKNGDWVGAKFISYVIDKYSNFIGEKKSDVPKDIQDIWIINTLFNSGEEIKGATIHEVSKEEKKEIKKTIKEKKKEEKTTGLPTEEEKAGSEWD